MSAIDLLNRLRGVRKVGAGRWAASCPGPIHLRGDRSRGLAVSETAEGVVLVRCFAGCGAAEIVAAVGLELHDLFPPRPDSDAYGKPIRAPFVAAQAYDALMHECRIVAIVAGDVFRGEPVTEQDFARLQVAMKRLNDIGERVYAR